MRANSDSKSKGAGENDSCISVEMANGPHSNRTSRSSSSGFPVIAPCGKLAIFPRAVFNDSVVLPTSACNTTMSSECLAISISAPSISLVRGTFQTQRQAMLGVNHPGGSSSFTTVVAAPTSRAILFKGGIHWDGMEKAVLYGLAPRLRRISGVASQPQLRVQDVNSED